MKIAIIDDSKNWRQKIKEEISKYLDISDEDIDMYSGGEQYLESQKKYDISFVDIEMAGIDGFETISSARKYNPDGFYIILTTHEELSRKGYIVNAFRYIYKMKLEELDEAISAVRVLQERNKTIEVSVIGGGIKELELKNIIFFETEKHYVVIHTKQGSIKSNSNMTDIEEMLPKEWFCRCHNVFIVNLDEIQRIDNRIIYLSNGDDIDVSHRRMKQFKQEYFNRQYECANK